MIHQHTTMTLKPTVVAFSDTMKRMEENVEFVEILGMIGQGNFNILRIIHGRVKIKDIFIRCTSKVL